MRHQQTTLGLAAWSLAMVSVLVLAPRCADAQELEPRAYWPMAVGLNVFTAVNNVSWGDVTFDPSLPVEEASARIDTIGVAYTRALSLAGRSANVTVTLPIVSGHVEGLLLGTFAEADRFGLGDPRVKLGMNLYGAPALDPKAFAAFRPHRIVGVSVTIAPPLGQYDSTKVINLGTNRWSIKPELGYNNTLGPWILELMGGVWFFTDNSDFLVEKTRHQNPIVSTQAHLTYRFQRNMWLAGDANFYSGGRTSIDGLPNFDLQRNSRVGATFSAALNRHHAIRASVSRGAYTTIGADFTSINVGYNFLWIR